jgi:phenylalanyl-tRNA synthetase beta chain
LFEFGKTYTKNGHAYQEDDHLALFTSGMINEASWNRKETEADFYFLKGVVEAVRVQSGIKPLQFEKTEDSKFEYFIIGSLGGQQLVTIGKPAPQLLKQFDIRVPVWYADIHWSNWAKAAQKGQIRYKEISKYPAVQRDLSFVAHEQLQYSEIEQLLNSLSIQTLKSFRLFDVFKSEKLGQGKQSLAMNFTFVDETKTMKDEEIDQWMTKISHQLENKLHAEIRK